MFFHYALFFVCLSSFQCQNGEPNVLSWCIPLVMSAMQCHLVWRRSLMERNEPSVYVVLKLGICPILRLGKPNLEFQVWVPILRLGKPNLESPMLPNLKIGQLHNLKIGLSKLFFWIYGPQ